MHGSIDFRTPAAGFDQPIEMWLACHQRVLRFAAMLNRLANHLATRGADEEAQIAATSIRRYFNEAAPRHHEDEDVDLFPRLRERLPAADDAALVAALERVEADHLAMAALWRSLDAALAEVCAGHTVELKRADVEQFERMYQQHIEIEEGELLPAMKRHFAAAEWDAIGRAMAARRGLDWDELS